MNDSMWLTFRQQLRDEWTTSRGFRIALIATAVYALLRLMIHFYSSFAILYPIDLELYLNAGNALGARDSLYPPIPIPIMEVFQYGPGFAWLMSGIGRLDRNLVMVLHSVLHVVGYVGLFWIWFRLAVTYEMPKLQRTLITTLPVWLIFSSFWADMVFLNTYLLLAWLSSVLLWAVLQKRVVLAVIMLSILAQTKPNWAFAMMIPLVLREWKFFAKVMIPSILIYLGVIGLQMLALTPEYVLAQYQGYFRLLANFGTHPMRGPDTPFMGYNHSILQIVVWLGGSQTLARVVKYALMLPGIGLTVYYLVKGADTERWAPFAAAFYLTLYSMVFIWLDAVWEASLGIVIFAYLLAYKPKGKLWWWVVFLPFALIDVWQVISYLIFGDAVLDETGSYILSDPSIYFPMTMLVIVVFHYVLLDVLWKMRRQGQKISA